MQQIDLMQQQILLERKMFDDGVRAWAASQTRNIERGNASDASWNRRLMSSLVLPMSEAIEEYVEGLKGKRGKRSKGAYMMQALDAKVVSYISLKTLLDMAGSARYADALTVRKLACVIGERIEDNVRFTRLEEAAPEYIAKVKESLKKAFSQSYTHRTNSLAGIERRLISNVKEGKTDYAFDLQEWVYWSEEDKIQIGLFLLDLIDRVLTLNGEPVIHIHRGEVIGQGARESVTVTLSDTVIKWCEEYAEEIGKLFPQFAPCVVPPRDWVAPFDGGYHTEEVASRLPLIKSGSFKHRKSLTREKMPLVYKAVNYLQSIAWQVNRELLDAAQSIVQCEGLQHDKALPSRKEWKKPESPVSSELADLRGKQLMAVLTKEDAERFLQWKADVREGITEDKARKARLLKLSSVIAQAQQYKNFDNIFFVWNIDSRGRVYCNSSRISPQGEDIGKSLIRLSNGAPLGEHGRKWLAVHGMGVWAEAVPNSEKKGDKISIEQRLEAVEMMQEEILDCAASPENFTMWLSADKPWQFLAWALEWARLIEWEREGNRTEDFVSHIPVALDGSCSGIQHYSAMLRDAEGGKHVNLTCETEQQDIYGEVARRTIEKLNAEIKMNGENKAIAQGWIDFGIDRGFCKKPVMTLPYGSSMLTSRENVVDKMQEKSMKAKSKARRLGIPHVPVHMFEVRDTEEQREFNKNAISYVNSIMWKEIGGTVPAARAAMKFIKAVTHHVAKAGKPLRWTTPLGLVVEQRICEAEESIIDTNLLGRIKITLNRYTDVIDVNAMKGAAAPNFVHSYDATHLMMVCNAAKDNGIEGIACIHDSFGAPAGQSELLSKLLRETFRDLYANNDPLASFLQEQEESLGEAIEVEMPEQGTLDINDIMHSQYCFI